MNFTGKNAIITGAGKGIGKAIALGMASRGANLVLVDIDEVRLDGTVQEAEALGVKVKKAVLNITDEALVNKVINDSIEEFGQIHILVNNAGIYTVNNFMDTTSDMWKKCIDVNILGTMYTTHAVLPHMIEKHYGRIVNIGSVAGEYGISYYVDYSMTKGAVISFTKALAKLVGDKGITVNCVSPGSIDITGGNDKMEDFSFLGRAGTPEECANLVMFVASDEASYISGQNYLVDGCRKKM